MGDKTMSSSTDTSYPSFAPTTGSDLLDLVRGAGIDVTACYQCGRCSAGCPVAEFFDLKPMQVVRMCCYGLREPLVSCRTIWLCASCETCTTRCPNGIDIARLMDVLRQLALASGQKAPEPKVKAFHRAFLKSVRSHGRVFEAGMIARYKLSSRDLFSDMGLGLTMLRQGKLRFFPDSIKGKKEIKNMFRSGRSTREKSTP